MLQLRVFTFLSDEHYSTFILQLQNNNNMNVLMEDFPNEGMTSLLF